MGKAVDIVGQIFGRLTVLARAGIHRAVGGGSTPLWLPMPLWPRSDCPRE